MKDQQNSETDPTRTGKSLLEETTMWSSGLFQKSTFAIPTLTFLTGDAVGKELPLIQQEITIGRSPEADVLILDSSVSRRHVQISCRRVVEKGKNPCLKVILQDLGSRNGTFVNYDKVDRVVLKAGDKIILGKVILRFDYRDSADRRFHDELYRLATIDSLTSLMNKSSIQRAFAEEVSKQLRYPTKLSVVMLDVDDFKGINDSFGHLVGDRALQVVSAILSRNLRKQDKAGRFGGEEFLVVLPETDLDGAMTLAERIRTDIELCAATDLGLARIVTVSLGVASFPGCSEDLNSLIEKADVALYEAKKSGKNRVAASTAAA